ncbi:MAG: DUF2292 domain-containing protein [Gammaproteobacteria bacterium]|nr:DUF2292 domain-containing protein [Gammaproteobacteria bacterium]
MFIYKPIIFYFGINPLGFQSRYVKLSSTHFQQPEGWAPTLSVNIKFMEGGMKQKLSQISRDEVDVINDIRELSFGRINIVIQDGVVVSKEITRVIKRSRNRNSGQRNIVESKNVNSSDNGYNNEEEVY